MNYSIIPAAFLITLFVVLIFSLFSKRPLRGLWLAFFIIFLATWSGQLWISPFGPVSWGIAWIPLVMVSVFFVILIAAFSPPVPAGNQPASAAEGGAVALGFFFWLLLILLILSIGLGYYRSPSILT
jgi:hypothetical protein